MKRAIVLYIPVLHQGYFDFLNSKAPIDTIFLITEDVLKNINPELAGALYRDLRAISAWEMKDILLHRDISQNVALLNSNNLCGFDEIVAPQDETVDAVLKAFYPNLSIAKVNIFLRWNKWAIGLKHAVVSDVEVTSEKFQQEIMSLAESLKEKSSDWWRQVASIIVPLESSPITSFNHHLPHEQSVYVDGDPRSNFKPGEHIEISTASHAEASAIAHAAKMGIKLLGASMYVTTFPCRVCAQLIGESGIEAVYYKEGYSQINAFEILKSFKCKIIKVE